MFPYLIHIYIYQLISLESAFPILFMFLIRVDERMYLYTTKGFLMSTSSTLIFLISKNRFFILPLFANIRPTFRQHHPDDGSLFLILFNQKFFKKSMQLKRRRNRILAQLLWLNIVSKIKDLRLTTGDKLGRVHLHQKFMIIVFSYCKDYCSICEESISWNCLQPWEKD